MLYSNINFKINSVHLLIGTKKMNYFSWLQKLRLSLVLIATTCIIACSSSSNSANYGDNASTKTISAITINNTEITPFFANSSTSTVVYIHNNTNEQISGISYPVTENSAHLPSMVSNAGSQSTKISTITTGVNIRSSSGCGNISLLQNQT